MKWHLLHGTMAAAAAQSCMSFICTCVPTPTRTLAHQVAATVSGVMLHGCRCLIVSVVHLLRSRFHSPTCTLTHQVAATVSGVSTAGDMLSAAIVNCSDAAMRLGIRPGMTGRAALELMRAQQTDEKKKPAAKL